MTAKHSFLTFKECGEPIDREVWGALRRLAGYKEAEKYDMLIFRFIALLDTKPKDLTILTWKDSGEAEGDMGGVGIFLASC